MSKIKFLKISSFYPEGISLLYKTQPELKTASYSVQYRAMMDQGIGWADYWNINLNKSGEFDSDLFIINNEYAQRKWAEENDFKFVGEDWMFPIILEQVRRKQPEILFANDYVFLNKDLVRRIRKEVPSIKVVLGWDGIGLCDPERFEGFDLIVSPGIQFVEFYRSKGFRAMLFQFGFESSLLEKLGRITKKYQVSFAGSLTLRKGGHHERLVLLGKMARSVQVNYWLSSFDTSKTYLLKNLIQKTLRGQLGDVYDILNLWSKNQGNVFGLDMFRILAESEITLNSHIDTAGSIAGNIRLWEATGVGACLVTDWKKNMHELFEDGKEVVLYRSPDECVEKVKYLLDHPAEMKAIAAAGQKRTLEQYSYEKRISDLIPTLKSLV